MWKMGKKINKILKPSTRNEHVRSDIDNISDDIDSSIDSNNNTTNQPTALALLPMLDVCGRSGFRVRSRFL